MKTDALTPVLSESRYRVKSSKHYTRSEILSGISLIPIKARFLILLLIIVASCYKSPLEWINALIFLSGRRKQLMALPPSGKILRFDEKYFQGLYMPPWRSKAFNKFVRSELHYYKPIKKQPYRFTNVFFAITKKCPLQCEHCYEGDLLNNKEQYTSDRILETIEDLQKLGVCNIHLSGGEPLLRTSLILEILNKYGRLSNFWINSSGYHLSEEKAEAFHKAGLMGVIISLDHFEEEKHNRFRNYYSAYENALKAIHNAKRANLIVALSICLTRETCSSEFLMSYMNLAKDLGVHFVQILEPRSVGNYKNKNIALTSDHLDCLERFYISMNYEKSYRRYPIVVYHGYSQRRAGCLNGYNRGFYINSNGDVNPCMFCKGSSGNIYQNSIQEIFARMPYKGCPSYD